MQPTLPHHHGNEELEAFLAEKMPEREHFQTVADIFKLLDDPTRLQIFFTLCHTEECVLNLSLLLGFSGPALSHHLKILKNGRIIVSRRDGKEVYYRAASTEAAAALHRTVEQIMMISCPEKQTACSPLDTASEEIGKQDAIIRSVHAYLASHLSERITIEELSHRFLINATTLKAAFKRKYGSSIATHINEHRMERAAELLLQSDLPISEIAKAVGFLSPGKFTAAFSHAFHLPPLEYRKTHRQT